MNEIVKKFFQGYIYFGKLQGKRMLFGSKVEASNFKDQSLTLLRSITHSPPKSCFHNEILQMLNENCCEAIWRIKKHYELENLIYTCLDTYFMLSKLVILWIRWNSTSHCVHGFTHLHGLTLRCLTGSWKFVSLIPP